MALTNVITFKKGQEADLQSKTSGIIKDAFYLTEDTHRLYIGINDSSIALLNSAIRVYDTLSGLTNDTQYKPETGDIAYVTKDDSQNFVNALVMYNGTSWVQINTPFDDSTITQEIVAIKSAASSAQSAAEAAQATADAAMPKTGGTFTGSVYGVTPTSSSTDTALTTKKYVDDAVNGLATEAYVQEQDEVVKQLVATAQSAAEAAQDTANAAMPKTGGNFTGDVTIKNVAVATSEDISAAKTAIIGGATLTTLKAIEDKHATDMSAINTKFDEVQGNVDSLTNVMTFIGVTEAEPSSATITIGGKSYTADIGDVVIYQTTGAEYVYTGSGVWEKFGEAGADAAAIADLSNKIANNKLAIESNDADIFNLQTASATINTRIDDVDAIAKSAVQTSVYEAYVESNNAKVTKLETDVNNTTTGLGATYILASNAATKADLNSEITARENAITEVVEQLTWGSF